MVFTKLYNLVYEKYFKKKEEKFRNFKLNIKQTFPCSNLVKTTKYTAYNFFFKNLYEQICIPSNFYFLIIAVLQSTPQISSTHGYPVVLLPLSTVIIFSMLKDAYEDYQRYLSDQQLNNALLQIVNLPCVTDPVKPIENLDVDTLDRYEFVRGAIRDNVLVVKYWKDLKVGEYVFLQNKDIAPADIVLLATSEENGYAFVDASSLDGETNIKKKEAIFGRRTHSADVYNTLGSDFEHVLTEVQRMLGSFSCEGPNKNLMNFEGKLEYTFSDAITPIPLSNNLIRLLTRHKSRLRTATSHAHVELSRMSSLEQLDPKTLSSDKLLDAHAGRPGFHRGLSVADRERLSRITSETNLQMLARNRRNSVELFQTRNTENRETQVSLTNLLLRGCKLMNTQWAIGFVVYTGHDTKIYRNISKAPYKISNLQRKSIYTTMIVCLLQLSLCLCATIYNMVQHATHAYDKFPYLKFPKDRSLTNLFFVTFFSWMALTANFVPISAVVTLNVVKLIQGFFIQLDKEMYCDELQLNAKARNTMLNEELGQVKYLFSDKTGGPRSRAGTLTSNKMVFRKFSLMGHSYGRGYTDVIRFVYAKKGIILESDEINPNYSKDSHVNLVDDTLFAELANTEHPRHEYLVEFFLHLVINNWGVPDSADENVYICSSPDELCFVNASAFAGFKLISRSSNFVVFRAFDKIYRVKVVAQADFDYKRKCSTTIVAFYRDAKLNYSDAAPAAGAAAGPLADTRDFSKLKPAKDRKSRVVSDEIVKEDLAQYRFVLYCKGGDNVMIPKLRRIDEVTASDIANLQKYSLGGLRTLMFGRREFEPEEFRAWLQEYNALKLTIESREEKLAECVGRLERDLELQGVTGIEDKLQKGVAECIESLLIAGINVWMLTGDNLHTAINIGIATNLINMLSDRIMLDTNSVRDLDLRQVMREHVERIDRDNDRTRHRCIIVDSVSMERILGDELSPLFLELITRVHSVLCCRMTPYLKGAVVAFVKARLKKITLAIGDGANDCNMIQTAHVGVGIKGKEGSQAFNASDFGIGQFRFLAPLLLHHGRCCYRRSSKCIIYMFYKNIALVIVLFYYGYITFYSGMKIYYQLFVAIYNVFFTSIPVTIVGVADQDYSKEFSAKYPHVYQLGQKNYYFNVANFSLWILSAILHSVVIFGMMTIGFSDMLSVPFREGQLADASTHGLVLMSYVLVTVTVKLILETWYFTRINTLSHLISLFVYVLTVMAFSGCPTLSGSFAGAGVVMLTSYRFWVVLIATTMAALYRDYFYKVFLYSFCPHYYHHIQRVEYLKLEQAHEFD